jgi:hypothetical protein
MEILSVYQTDPPHVLYKQRPVIQRSPEHHSTEIYLQTLTCQRKHMIMRILEASFDEIVIHISTSKTQWRAVLLCMCEKRH